jgi:phenylacetate-CoA ligase
MRNLCKLWIERAVYPAMERFRGNRVRAYTEALAGTESLSPAALRDHQADELRRLLLFCAEKIPAYRALSLTPEQIARDPFAALLRAPVLTKQAFRAGPDRYRDPARPPERLILNKTSGSTGEPVRFLLDRPAVEQYEAARWLGLRRWGVSCGSRSVMVWGNPIELAEGQRLASRLKDRFLKNRVILSAYRLRPEDTPRYIRFLNRFQPEYLYGYATALDALAGLLEGRAGELRLQLKVVVSTSETLWPWQRARLSRVFGCPVAGEYGARDAGILAYECPCGRLHLFSQNAVLEILDPRTLEPVPAGQTGVVAVTDLHNFAMPRLRWLLGDTAALSPDGCPCGLPEPVLQELGGREDALFLLPDGTLVHGNFAGQLSRKYPSVAKFQLVQTDRRHAVLRLVQPEPDASGAESFCREVAAMLPGVDVQLALADHLEPGPSGKFRCAVRAFDLPAAPRSGGGASSK